METVSSSFCRVCGHAVSGVVCENCGCKPLSGNSFCNACGSETLPQAVMCPKCKNYFPSEISETYIDTFEDLGVNSSRKISKKGVWITIGLVAIGMIIIVFASRSNSISSLRSSVNSRLQELTQKTEHPSTDAVTVKDLEEMETKLDKLAALKADIVLLFEKTNHQEDVSLKTQMVDSEIDAVETYIRLYKQVLSDRGVNVSDNQPQFKSNMMEQFQSGGENKDGDTTYLEKYKRVTSPN